MTRKVKGQKWRGEQEEGITCERRGAKANEKTRREARLFQEKGHSVTSEKKKPVAADREHDPAPHPPPPPLLYG